ncbi:hypothetical protein J6590_012643 [Homalodisca vitripennis]|nr:hypothetical protein J6590_012643 [Homalodisca vitripennis]
MRGLSGKRHVLNEKRFQGETNYLNGNNQSLWCSPSVGVSFKLTEIVLRTSAHLVHMNDLLSVKVDRSTRINVTTDDQIGTKTLSLRNEVTTGGEGLGLRGRVVGGSGRTAESILLMSLSAWRVPHPLIATQPSTLGRLSGDSFIWDSRALTC